jgi:cytidylate kinase
MPVITISRELAALGDEIAKELEKQTSYRFIDRCTVEKRIKSYGVSDHFFAKFDERKPSFFAAISQERDDYLHYLKQALLDEAEEGNCIFMGRGAFSVFKNAPGVLPVFLVSDMSVRIARVRSYFRCNEHRAKQIIYQSDSDRAGFHHYFFETEWKDPENYHITINTSRVNPQTCAEVIVNLAKNLFDTQTAQKACEKLKDLRAAQTVINHILYEKKIGVHFLEANVENNTVTLFGIANSATMIEAARTAAGEVPGIEKAVSKMQVIHEFSIMP